MRRICRLPNDLRRTLTYADFSAYTAESRKTSNEAKAVAATNSVYKLPNETLQLGLHEHTYARFGRQRTPPVPPTKVQTETKTRMRMDT